MFTATYDLDFNFLVVEVVGCLILNIDDINSLLHPLTLEGNLLYLVASTNVRTAHILTSPNIMTAPYFYTPLY